MRHEIKSIYLIHNLLGIKGREWDRGRISRRAKQYLNAIINKQIKRR